MSIGGLPILMYHAFDATGCVTATDPAWFAETLSALTVAGYRSVDLESWIAQGRPALDRRFAITIDDGLRSIFEVADVLTRHEASATVFLVTDRVGSDNDWPGQPAKVRRRPLLSWAEIDALAASGLRFAAHGCTHVALEHCGDAELDFELRGSREAIEQHFGRPCPLFAYPYGRSNPRVRRAVGRHFAAAFGTRLDMADDRQDIHQISRIDAYYLRSKRTLDRLTTGRLQGWLRGRRILREGRGVLTTSLSWRPARA